MNRKIIDGLFISLIVCLMFEGIPKLLYFRFLGGPITAKLVWIPLVIGLLYTLYCNYKYKNVFVNFDKFLKYIAVYFGIVLFSLVLGLYNYPFYGEIQIRESDQAIISSYIGSHIIGILDCESQQFAVLLYVIRKLKFIFLETFWCFGGSYMIYCWYKNHYVEARNALFKGIIISAVILGFFGIIETAKIFGDENAKQILINIAPFLHENATTSWGWPPKLWPNMRLVFSESSFIGNYLAFFMPCLYYLYYKKDKWYCLGFVYLISFYTFLTKSRTCWALMFGAMFLLLLCNFIWKNKRSFYKFISITFVTLIAFGSYIGFLNFKHVYENKLIASNNIVTKLNFSEQKQNKSVIKSKNDLPNRSNKVSNDKSVAYDELKNNLTNLASSTARSNAVRYGVMKANFRVFLEHPIFGVGSGLQSAYAVNSYTEYEANLGEIKRWIAAYKRNGPFGKDVLGHSFNEYINRLVATGVLGFVSYIFPFIYVLFKLIGMFFKKNIKDEVDLGFVIIMLFTSLIAGINVQLNVVYCVWVALGMAYVIVDQKKIENNYISK